MTTKPKARRFRLRLGDDATGAPRPDVAPVRATPPRPEAATPAPAAPAAAAPARPAMPRPAAPSAAAPAAPAAASPRQPTDSLFDEAEAPSPAPARPAPSTPPRPAPVEHSADVTGSARIEAEIEAIRAEELSGRQLRMAMRVAQRNGVKATSGLEAVRLLRKQGIDPFEPSTLLDIIRDQTRSPDTNPATDGPAGPDASGQSRALTTTEQPKLPKAYRQSPVPGPAAAPLPATDDARRKAEVSRIQLDIQRRRRRRMALLAARLMVFVGLPTLIVAFYFNSIATPLYATESQFIVQQADNSGGGGAGTLAGMFGGASLGSGNDSRAVQSFLQSRDAMRRLDAEEGFKAYFQSESIDPLRRLAPDATDEAAYRLYERMVQVSFDPTEGIIQMEVIAADPETSERFARALISYAEEQVDQLTQRLRENQMRDAQQHVESAEAQMREAQQRVLDLQERFQILSSEVEVTLLTQQITNLETQLNQERLALADLQANARPNRARLEQAQRRIATLEDQITTLRGSLTDSGDGGTSLARIQREQVMAESDVATRQLLLAQAMQQLEAARIEANRQVRYLSVGVTPVAPDEPTYPRVFEDTALAFLIFSGIYLMVSMTAAILREQVTG